MSDSVRPHRRQPTRLPRPWASQGKNTGVGCHFLFQCMKVKSESEVAQSCPTLRPHGLQPTRLLRPWDSPGKRTGVGCHCLLRRWVLGGIKWAARLQGSESQGFRVKAGQIRGVVFRVYHPYLCLKKRGSERLSYSPEVTQPASREPGLAWRPLQGSCPRHHRTDAG